PRIRQRGCNDGPHGRSERRPMAATTADHAILTGFPDYLAWRLCALLLRRRPGLAIDALVGPGGAGPAASPAREPGALARAVSAGMRMCRPRPPAASILPSRLR